MHGHSPEAACGVLVASGVALWAGAPCHVTQALRVDATLHELASTAPIRCRLSRAGAALLQRAT